MLYISSFLANDFIAIRRMDTEPLTLVSGILALAFLYFTDFVFNLLKKFAACDVYIRISLLLFHSTNEFALRICCVRHKNNKLNIIMFEHTMNLFTQNRRENLSCFIFIKVKVLESLLLICRAVRKK